jgi:hypothetical protein
MHAANRALADDIVDTDASSIPSPIAAGHAAATERLAKVNLFALREALSPLLILPAAIPALAAVLTPANAIDSYRALAAFVQWMTAQVPFMDGYANPVGGQQIDILVCCLMFAIVPVMVLVILWQSYVNYPRTLHRQRSARTWPIGAHVMILIAPELCGGAIAAMVMITGDIAWSKAINVERRLVQAMFASLLTYLSALAIGSQIMNVCLFVDTRFSGR